MNSGYLTDYKSDASCFLFSMFLFVAKFVHADTIFMRIFRTLTHFEDAGKSDELEDCGRLLRLRPSRCGAVWCCDPALLWGAEGVLGERSCAAPALAQGIVPRGKKQDRDLAERGGMGCPGWVIKAAV